MHIRPFQSADHDQVVQLWKEVFGYAAALAARGCPKVNLQLLATNATTVAFYQSLGYEVEERISMGKRLCEPPNT